MITLRTILCPVDFSETARDALRWAVILAGHYHSRLIVLTAVEPLLANAAQARFKLDLRTATEPVLENFVAGAVSSVKPDEPRYDLDVQIGPASDVIVDAAARHSADLLVMGTHGIGGLRKLLLGSTTQRVLRHTPIPVLAVPPRDAGPNGGTQRPRLPLATVLAATDFSEPSENAVQWAIDLAQQHAAELLVAHVVAPLIVRVEWTGYLEGINEERVNAARVRLDERAANVGADVQIETVVVLGWPVESIAAMANTRNVNLLVMGLTGTERVLGPRPGSTAYGVLSSVHVPVLVLPGIGA